MINFTDKDSTQKLISIEKNSIKATLDIQKNLNKQILVFMKNFVGNIEVDINFDPNNKAYYYMNESTNALNKSNENISLIQKLLDKLDKINSQYDTLPPSKIKIKIESYNKAFTKNINSIYSNTENIEKFIHEISLLDLSSFLKDLKKATNKNKKIEEIKEKEKKDYLITSKELNTSFIENTLVISDIQGKVILPYKIDIVKTILEKNKEKFDSIENVINTLFTIPISYYRFPSISRFREAYKLVTEREHESKIKALSLASELFMNYNLHPAIITACENIDQLDIYLACLEDNALEDFKFFNIKYEIAPALNNEKENWEHS